MTRSIWISAVAAAGACLALTTAACGAAGEVTTSPVQASATPTATSAVDSAAPADPSRPESSTPSASAPTEPDLEPYRTLRGSFEGVAVRAEVYPIRRGSRTATANVRFVVAKGSRTFRILESLNDRNPELGDKGQDLPRRGAARRRSGGQGVPASDHRRSGMPVQPSDQRMDRPLHRCHCLGDLRRPAHRTTDHGSPLTPLWDGERCPDPLIALPDEPGCSWPAP